MNKHSADATTAEEALAIQETLDSNMATEVAMKNTLLTPRFYTTDFDELDAVDVSHIRSEWDPLIDRMLSDPNKGHFKKNDDWDQVDWDNMEPQLKKGDFLLVNKYAYGIKVNRIGIPNFLRTEPQYGDAVVLIPPHNPVPFIKRLIGKPGDTIRLINKQLYVNGKVLQRMPVKSEEIVIQKRKFTADLYSENNGSANYIVRNIRGINKQAPKSGCSRRSLFCHGDNRDNSNDSTKDVGFVPRENFFGRADYLWMTWECWTCLPSFKKVGRIN